MAGKRADIILIRGNDINIAPVADIEASVVQSATPANVDTVLADGRIVKRGGKLAYDVDKIVRDAKAAALRIRTLAGGRLRADVGCTLRLQDEKSIASCKPAPESANLSDPKCSQAKTAKPMELISYHKG